MTDYDFTKYTVDNSQTLSLRDNRTPNHTVKFHNQAGDVVGTLDFNGPALTFVGNAQESAKMFFHVFVAEYLAERLNYERVTEREECAKLAEGRFFDGSTDPIAREIRARGEK